MDLRRLRPALVLSVWSLLVWTTRIRNIWTDDSLSTCGQLWRTALAVSFTVFAVVTVAAWFSSRRRGATVSSRLSLWVQAFALWTVLVWLVRGVQILLADHDAAFKAVHTVLAVVSIVLALRADREMNRRARPTAASV